MTTRNDPAILEAAEAGVPATIFDQLDELTDEQRLMVFSAYCKWCGGIGSGRCYCYRDD